MAATIADSQAHVVQKAVETGEEAKENMEVETLTVEPTTQTEVNADPCPGTSSENVQEVEVAQSNLEQADAEVTNTSDEKDICQDPVLNPTGESLSTEELSALVEELTTNDDEPEISNNGAFSDNLDQPDSEAIENDECLDNENVNLVEDNLDTLEKVSLEGISSDEQKPSVPDERLPEGSSSSSGSMNASTESDDLSEAVSSKKDDTSDLLKTVIQIQKNKSPEKKTVTSGKASKTEDKKQTKNDEAIPKSSSGKSKKKEDKSIEHILRALSSLQTTEEKLAALCKKYADLHEDHRVVQSSFKQVQRKLTVTTREKDQLQSEHTKAVMAKSKLESLCRELQKHNQMIRQESLQRAREEDEKRKEISAKFQSTIGEIQQQMKENHERNVKLREENAELAGKLKKFIEQYEHREKQVEKVMQHREIEQKLADAKLAQANALSKEMDEKHRQEKEILLLQAAEHQKKSKLLDAQLDMYKEKYEEFQSTINRSNEMFQKFKTEMDKMTKRIKKLEKEGAQWKSKWEGANRALLEMVEEKTRYDRERPQLLAKISKLESLCRAMQAERQGKTLLESAGIDVSSLDTISTQEPTKSSVSNSSPSPSDGTPDPVLERKTNSHTDTNCSAVCNADPDADAVHDVTTSVDPGETEPIQSNCQVNQVEGEGSEIKACDMTSTENENIPSGNVDIAT